MRPPEVVACIDCAPGHRCEAHKRPLVVSWQGGRPVCPACGCEQNWPNKPKVHGCLPSCPRYGRRARLEATRPPFEASPPPAPPPANKKSFGASGHTFHDAAPMLDRVRAWEALERACDAWAQHRDEAARGATSPLALLRLESDIEIATQALRKLRGDQR